MGSSKEYFLTFFYLQPLCLLLENGKEIIGFPSTISIKAIAHFKLKNKALWKKMVTQGFRVGTTIKISPVTDIKSVSMTFSLSPDGENNVTIPQDDMMQQIYPSVRYLSEKYEFYTGCVSSTFSARAKDFVGNGLEVFSIQYKKLSTENEAMHPLMGVTKLYFNTKQDSKVVDSKVHLVNFFLKVESPYAVLGGNLVETGEILDIGENIM